MSVVSLNPCLTCGACCAFYRASFYWAEAEPSFVSVLEPIAVPPEYTQPINAHLVAMKGTCGSRPRCVCLEGEIGKEVHCSIYAVRSSSCREFAYSGQDGVRNERCERARRAWGLEPLVPEDPPGTLLPDTHRVA